MNEFIKVVYANQIETSDKERSIYPYYKATYRQAGFYC